MSSQADISNNDVGDRRIVIRILAKAANGHAVTAVDRQLRDDGVRDEYTKTEIQNTEAAYILAINVKGPRLDGNCIIASRRWLLSAHKRLLPMRVIRDGCSILPWNPPS